MKAKLSAEDASYWEENLSDDIFQWFLEVLDKCVGEGQIEGIRQEQIAGKRRLLRL